MSFESLQRIQFYSNVSGPRILFLGAIHGNEICGPLAIRRFVSEIESQKLAITRGSVSFVPVCNPRAFAEKKRFFEMNLNRCIRPEAQGSTYEERLAPQICEWILDCDVLVDLHSFQSAGDPFMVWQTNDQKSLDLVKSLGPYDLMTGFSEIYRGVSHIQPDMTLAFAERHNKRCALIECGSHMDPQAPEVAYRAIRGALDYLGILDFAERPERSVRRLWTLFELQIKDREGSFVKDFVEFEALRKGQEIIRATDASLIRASEDAYIVFPAAQAQIKQEWFSLARPGEV